MPVECQFTGTGTAPMNDPPNVASKKPVSLHITIAYLSPGPPPGAASRTRGEPRDPHLGHVEDTATGDDDWFGHSSTFLQYRNASERTRDEILRDPDDPPGTFCTGARSTAPRIQKVPVPTSSKIQVSDVPERLRSTTHSHRDNLPDEHGDTCSASPCHNASPNGLEAYSRFTYWQCRSFPVATPDAARR